MQLPSVFSTLSALAAVAASESADQQLLDVDGTLFLQLGLFLALIAVLNAWLFKPYLRIRAERVTRVEGYRADAVRLEADAAARFARCDAELAEARRVGAGERAVARAEAHAREQTLLAEAQAAAQRTLKEKRAEIEVVLAAERATLRTRVADLGREAGRKVLGRPVTS